MGVLQQLLKPYVKSVQKSADKYGGGLTWAFSQCLDPVASVIGTNKATADGICELLSAKWIEEHAYGRSLRAWLCSGGTAIDPSKLRLLMQLFIIGEQMTPEKMIDPVARIKKARYEGTTNQSKATANYLRSHGIEVVDEQGNFEAWREGQQGGGEKIKHGLADAICAGYSGPGGRAVYRTLGVWGFVGGHAMASCKNGTTITYFDPNFGEFTFGDADSFKSWFVDGFFPKSFYTKFLGNRYEVYKYART